MEFEMEKRKRFNYDIYGHIIGWSARHDWHNRAKKQRDHKKGTKEEGKPMSKSHRN